MQIQAIDMVSASFGLEPKFTDKLIKGALNKAPVKGLTHGFYRYPARFSPAFVRGVIETFTEPGDWVIDPFVGGGTTLVEAMALGRNALGIDISSLSSFLCEAKTQILEDEDIASIRRWMANIETTINMHAPTFRNHSYADAGYYRNLESPSVWRLRKAIEQSLGSVGRLRRCKAQMLTRCIVLRTAQWALDSRKSRPNIKKFKAQLEKQSGLMLEGAIQFRNRVESLELASLPQTLSLNRTTAGAEHEAVVKRICPPKLIVTSPPYPGIHVVYHRWQVDGRRETPAPFWIANKLDGEGPSYYTMGDYRNPGLQSYFYNLKDIFSSVAEMSGEDTTIVQMVAFSDSEWQLPKYLSIMEECGLKEILPWDTAPVGKDGRLWRDVPNRRWYAQKKSRAPGAREVVLIHRKVVV